jgi:hypothetical protein
MRQSAAEGISRKRRIIGRHLYIRLAGGQTAKLKFTAGQPFVAATLYSLISKVDRAFWSYTTRLVPRR